MPAMSQKRQNTIFSTIKSEGSVLPMDLLRRVSDPQNAQLSGLTPDDYYLTAMKLSEAINKAWTELLGVWQNFQSKRKNLPANNPGTETTCRYWLLPLFEFLKYGRLQARPPLVVGERSYAISHGWEHTPIHLVSFRADLDKSVTSEKGERRPSPHSLLQELLNRSPEHLWGIVSNGLTLRILRNNVSLTRQAYVEFDLEEMFEHEVYADFVLFWLLCHASRFEKSEKAPQGWLENWSKEAHQNGIQALDHLRDNVTSALKELGSGFIAHPANGQLRQRLGDGTLSALAYYNQLLRLVYRLLVLFVAEDRNILHDPAAPPSSKKLYQEYYSTARLRALADRTLGTRHSDLYYGLQLIMERLGQEDGCPELGLPALNGKLFHPDAIADLNDCQLANYALLAAVRHLGYIESGRVRRVIDYKNLGSEELGSVYESLLELHPVFHLDAGKFELASASGNARKTTGSYYTPTSLITCLLDSALDPVLNEAANQPDAEAAILNLKICDPACGSGHFLVAAAHRIAKRLAAVRTGDEEPSPDARRTALRDVVGRCIYGVDINPMAVELCKVSLWMEAIEPGKPLSFLDHHLRPGNALIGAWLEEVATSEHPKTKLAKKRATSLLDLAETATDDEEIVQFSMLEDPEFSQGLSDALDMMGSIEQVGGNTVQEVKQQEAAYAELRERFAEKYQDVMNLGAALFYTIEIPYRLWGTYAAYAVKAPEEQQQTLGAQQHAQILQQARSLGERKRFFHWELEFPDIFFERDGTPKGELAGFDAIVGNPPYVRQEKLSEDKPFYQDHYDVYHGAADLFVYFFGQGLRLLRPGGRLAYISSNSWLRANYATPLRRSLRLQTSVEQIIDLGNTRVFPDAPDLSPAIQVVRKQPPTNGHLARAAIFSRGDTISEFRDNLDGRFFDVSIHDQPDEGWQLRSDSSRQLLLKIMAKGRPLDEVVNGQMYYGVKTGLNDAFIIDDVTRKRLIQADPACTQLIKPLVRGEDLRPWYQEDEGRWLIFAYRGINIDTYPAIKAHLSQFRDRLEPRPRELGSNEPWSGRKAGSYKWYEIQDTVEYAKAFDGTKIFYPDITKKPRFSWGGPDIYTSNTGYFIPTQSDELLGTLNSRVIWFVITQISHPLAERKGALIYRLFSQYIERLPIPTLTDEQRAQIGGLAQQLTAVAKERYRARREVMQRVKSDLGTDQSKVTNRLDEWWRLDWQGFRDEVRKSFKREIPLKERGEWQALFLEHQSETEQLTAEVVRLEEELNAAVYAAYGLNEEEIALIERETKYQYGEW